MGWQKSHLYLFKQGQQLWTHPSDQESFLDDDSDVEQQPDTEAYTDHLDDAIETRIQWIGELFGLCDVQELPTSEPYLLQRQFNIQLSAAAKTLLCFSTAAPSKTS